MTTAVTTGFSKDNLDAFLAARSEPAWLADQRREHFHTFEQLAWPQRNDEEWIRTDIRLFKLNQFAPPVGQVSNLSSDKSGQVENLSYGDALPLLTQGVDLAGRTAALDSRPLASTLKPKWAEKGVIFGSLDELVHTHGELIRKHLFTRAVDPTYDKFAALHAAFWSGGHLLYVPRGIVVDEPLHALSALNHGGTDLSHTLVILDEGAEATLMVETASHAEPDGGFHCGATEVILGQGSRFRLVSLQNWGHGVWHFAHQKALVGRDASLQWTIAAIGSRLSKVNQHVELVGRGAECQVNGVFFTEGKQHISYHTLQHHAAPQCRSDFLYKSALQDQSRTVWRGMIKVDPLAQQTNGYQRNDNLLLSPNARADSIPGLEIEADDVRCTHGSTSGKVDEEQIFYAQARGFTRREATRMIVSGFFQQVFDRIVANPVQVVDPYAATEDESAIVITDSVRDALAAAISRRVREYS